MAEFAVRDYLPSALVALVLASVAIVVWRARADKANRWFAAFLMLVALNYTFEGLSYALNRGDPAVPRAGLAGALQILGFVCGILDPVALLGFAGVYPRRNALAGRRARGAQASVALLLLLLLLLDPVSLLAFRGPWRYLLEAYVLGTYLVVVACFLYMEARRPPDAPPVLPRGFLLAWWVVFSFRVSPSLGVYHWFDPVIPQDPSILTQLYYFGVHALTAWAIIAAGVGLLVARTRTPHRVELIRGGVHAGIAVSAICAVLVLPFVLAVVLYGGRPPLDGAVSQLISYSYRLVFPVRWMFFAVVVGAALISNQVFDMDMRLRRTIVASVVAGSLFVLFLMGAYIIQQDITHEGALPTKTFLVLALIALVATQSAHVGRRVGDRFFPPERDHDEAYWRLRRFEVYRDAARAAAEDRVSAGDLERLRVSLGLTPEDARTAASLDRPRARDAALEAGSVLAGRYELVAPVGRGAHGRVFRALDRRDNRVVAVKEVDADPHRGSAARIEREVLAARKLRHPNLLAACDYFVEGSSAFLVTPYMPGGSLADRLRRDGPLAPDEAVAVGLDVLAGLAAAHEAGVLHRDVKPANVLFDGDCRARLGDFGVALVRERGHTATSVFDPRVPGTLGYLPPEALSGAATGPGWDVYAVGTLLQEALLGRVPTDGVELPGHVPTALTDIVRRARHPDPGVRYPSASTMRQALEKWAAERPGEEAGGPDVVGG